MLTIPKEEYLIELENVVNMVQKLSNKIADMEKEKEASLSKKQFKPFFNKREESGTSQPPVYNYSILNFNEVGMDHFCTFHQELHSEKSFPQWINSMTLVMNQILDAQITDPEVGEEKTNELEETHETTMVLWDCAPTLGLDEEESTEEIQLSAVNVKTKSKGPIMDESLLLPNIMKIQENMKMISSNTQTPPKYDLVTTKDKVTTVSKHVKVVESKTKRNKKGPVEYDMGYDIVEDIKKTKADISLFELCNLPQQINKLMEAFDPRPSRSQDDIQSWNIFFYLNIN